ncbi:hypothetical protein [Catenuloplanes atrovinosus]|uniref:Lipoprotein n=1 Tax=Catenuloplanes atrovinosus TaxID=137266 RepID=A0AAE4C9V5_9ACTN|nr:hypothetical protein [Catenuloplanes atrovinosus]MDR7276222.1 hypothetical protein [Catenuloplanes atrovinosus]
MRRVLLPWACGLLLLAGCAAPRPPGPTVAQVLADIRASAELLRTGSYRATFDVRIPDQTVRWTGVLRTLGGTGAIWSVDGTVSDDGRIIDALSVVDAGGVRYLDSMTKTFHGYEWGALSGSDRLTYYWRGGAPRPLPDVDPYLWCDLTGARVAVTARTLDGGTRYRLTGWTPGPALAYALGRAGLAPGAPGTVLDLTLAADGRPARLDATTAGTTVTLVVTGTGIRERIKVPERGQFTSMHYWF